jgi:hypothetical protein
VFVAFEVSRRQSKAHRGLGAEGPRADLGGGDRDNTIRFKRSSAGSSDNAAMINRYKRRALP